MNQNIIRYGLNIKGGTISSESYAIYTYDKSTTIIENGKIESTGNNAIYNGRHSNNRWWNN